MRRFEAIIWTSDEYLPPEEVRTKIQKEQIAGQIWTTMPFKLQYIPDENRAIAEAIVHAKAYFFDHCWRRRSDVHLCIICLPDGKPAKYISI